MRVGQFIGVSHGSYRHLGSLRWRMDTVPRVVGRWLLALAICIGLSWQPGAQAAGTVTSSGTTGGQPRYYGNFGACAYNGTCIATTYVAACAGYRAYGQGAGSFHGTDFSEVSGATCFIKHDADNTHQTSPMGVWDYNGTIQSCPTNATLSGSTCQCNTGYVPGGNPFGSACESAVTNCAAVAAGIAPEYQFVAAVKPDGLSFCMMTPSSTNCSMSGTFAAEGWDGKWYLSGPYTSNGTDCTPVINAPSPAASPASSPTTNPTCPVGKIPGQVNGTTVCVTPGATVGKETYAASSPSGSASAPVQTVSDGNGGTIAVPPGGSATKVTTCTGATCTTVVTVKDGTGATVGTASSGWSKGGFCAENPDTSICKGDSQFSGSCGAGFTCSGDGIQCAIAREQYTRNCQVFDATGSVRDTGQAAIDRGDTKASDHPGAAGNITTVGTGYSTADTTDLLGGGSCPADQVVTVTGTKTVTLAWSKICTPAGYLGNILLGLTWIAWCFIAFKTN